MVRQPRPYVRSSFKVNFYIEENMPASSKVLDNLAVAFLRNGFKRKLVKMSNLKNEEYDGTDEVQNLNVKNGILIK